MRRCANGWWRHERGYHTPGAALRPPAAGRAYRVDRQGEIVVVRQGEPTHATRPALAAFGIGQARAKHAMYDDHGGLLAACISVEPRKIGPRRLAAAGQHKQQEDAKPCHP